jgi:protein TonB
MKPELILQSDVLDIVFENKNKSYGAYELRKQYNRRLTKSMFITVVAVIVFSIMQSWKVPHRKGSIAFTGLDSVKLVQMEIPKDEPVKPKEIKQPQQKAQVDYQNIIIVQDSQVTDTLPTMEQISKSNIGNMKIEGEEVAPEEINTASSKGNETSIGETIEVEKPLYKAEFMPQFPGGTTAFLKFMQRNLKEPDDLEDAQKFVVIADFIVDTDGNISDVKIEQMARPDLDAEVIRVIKKMPQWIAGMQNGRKVPVFFKLPVTFMAHE